MRLVLEISGRAPVELPAQGKLVLGSDSARTDVSLDGQGVDGVHCAIGKVKGGGWALKDLGSAFGTMVNGERVETARLKAGDTILLGSMRLKVVDPTAAVIEEDEPAPVKSAAPKKKAAPAAKPKSQASSKAKAKTPEIAGYTLDRRIGRGGTGEVWLATQKSLDRRVALKFLSSRLEADPTFVERFQAEARAAAALNHPNVVTVHDVGEGSGHHYLTMEFMAAGCLEERLSALGPIAWREALRVLLDAARGLEYAESRGVVHRDIKPANLMQTEDGITKICDLGLAVQLEQEEVQADGKKIVGTPHFLPPEVLRGERADSRSDLYSLGATAYRILSGHTPFEGETTKEILRGALNDEPEPLALVVPGIPSGVSELVNRLLEKDPADRTPSASVLVRELERLIAEDGASKGAPAAAKGGSKTPLIAVGAVVALGAIAAVMFGGNGDDPPEDPDPGPKPVDQQAATGDGETGTGTGDSETGDNPSDTPGPNEVDEGSAPGTGMDDEAAKELENKAKNALITLNSTQLSDEDRVGALRDLANRFLGTDTSEEALNLADELEAKIAAEQTELAGQDRMRRDLLLTIKAAANLEAEDPPRPGDSLRAMAAVPDQEVWQTDSEFLIERTRLRDQVLDRAVSYANDAIAGAEGQRDAGDFPGMVETCRSIIVLVDLPAMEPEPVQVVTLRAVADRARTMRDNAAAIESDWHEARRNADRAALATSLGGRTGLEAELATCELSAAEERLMGLAAVLVTDADKARASAWAEEVRDAQKGLKLLATTWDAGEWKRKAVLDPSGSSRNVSGVSSRGVTIGTDTIPWADFAGAMRSWDNLFQARLDRDWTAEECSHIAALLRLQAVAHAVDLARSVLGSTGRLSSGEADDLAAGFEYARRWADQSGDTDALEREEAAQAALARALVAYGEERWSEAVAGLEVLLEDHSSSLVVTLLSDGSPWMAADSSPEEDNSSSDNSPGESGPGESGPGETEDDSNGQ